ncbi:hypothetical protein OUZ56_026127 [Daphnia magna]|uniref:Uncharacterized protein n=1 Tax=Daphnia magna TaxID=35525 RepID=A0ABQ9ZKX8_9CRUS|nr:hypothetical protein OUZ56_026127 [Daphnia magna]
MRGQYIQTHGHCLTWDSVQSGNGLPYYITDADFSDLNRHTHIHKSLDGVLNHHPNTDANLIAMALGDALPGNKPTTIQRLKLGYDCAIWRFLLLLHRKPKYSSALGVRALPYRAVKHPALRVFHKCAKSHLCPSWSAAAAASYGETIFFAGSSLLAEEIRLLPEIRLLQGDEQQTIHKQ